MVEGGKGCGPMNRCSDGLLRQVFFLFVIESKKKKRKKKEKFIR